MLTFDRRRVGDLQDAINDAKVFHSDALCFSTCSLLQHRLIYRLSNWKTHVERSIGPDLELLFGLLDCQNYSDEAWMSPQRIARAVKAEFRSMYFVHGMSTVYNYQTMKLMFLYTKEAASYIDGIVHLRPLYDSVSDQYVFPLFSSRLPCDVMDCVRFVYNVNRVMNEKFSNDTGELERYFVTCYAAWTYTRCMYVKSALSLVDVDEVIAESADIYESVFSLNVFLDRYSKLTRRECDVRIVGSVQADYISRKIVLDPMTTFGRIISCCVNAKA